MLRAAHDLGLALSALRLFPHTHTPWVCEVNIDISNNDIDIAPTLIPFSWRAYARGRGGARDGSGSTPGAPTEHGANPIPAPSLRASASFAV